MAASSVLEQHTSWIFLPTVLPCRGFGQAMSAPQRAGRPASSPPFQPCEIAYSDVLDQRLEP
jgi:hypothetical protein